MYPMNWFKPPIKHKINYNYATSSNNSFHKNNFSWEASTLNMSDRVISFNSNWTSMQDNQTKLIRSSNTSSKTPKYANSNINTTFTKYSASHNIKKSQFLAWDLSKVMDLITEREQVRSTFEGNSSKNKVKSHLSPDNKHGKSVAWWNRNTIFTAYKAASRHKILPKITDIKGNSNNTNKRFLLPLHGTQYKMPVNYKTISDEIKTTINTLLTENTYDRTNEDCVKTPSNLMKYPDVFIEKINLIDAFISTLPEKNFISDKQRYRKIYVILNGTVILNRTFINGIYVDLPNTAQLSFLKTKKKRLEKYYEFLFDCNSKLHVNIKTIFLKNGFPIFDWIDVPESEKCIYVSTNNIFQGIHFFNEEVNKIGGVSLNENDLKKLEYKAEGRSVAKTLDIKMKINVKKRKNNVKAFKMKSRKRFYLTDQSFTFGWTSGDDIQEYEYYSENETKKRKVHNYWATFYPTKNQSIIHFNQDHLRQKIFQLKQNSLKAIQKFNDKRINENTKNGLIKLINAYNNMRAKKHKINVKHKLKHEISEEEKIKEYTMNYLKTFATKLNKFRKNHSGTKPWDAITLYDKIKEKKNMLMQANIKKTQSIVYQSDFCTEKYYPDWISFNFPKMLINFPVLKRRTFYEIFTQFKTLLKICVGWKKNLKWVKEGIDFDTFYLCSPQIYSQGEIWAKKWYNTINQMNCDYLNLEEYMAGMWTMKTKNLCDKLNLFLNIIDSDCNGKLSFDEVYDISYVSLSRSTRADKLKYKNEPDEITAILANYFAKLIFQLVDKPVDQEIPISYIKDKIWQGGPSGEYLEMFICADNFI